VEEMKSETNVSGSTTPEGLKADWVKE